MALLEGGQFVCYTHDFKTTNLEEWNEHCSDPENEHTEQGYTACTSCGERIEFEGLPFHPIKEDGSKGIQLKCEECTEKTQGKVKMKKTITITSNKEGGGSSTK